MRSSPARRPSIYIFPGIGQRLNPLEGTVSPRGFAIRSSRGVAFRASSLKLGWVYVCAETGSRQDSAGSSKSCFAERTTNLPPADGNPQPGYVTSTFVSRSRSGPRSAPRKSAGTSTTSECLACSVNPPARATPSVTVASPRNSYFPGWATAPVAMKYGFSKSLSVIVTSGIVQRRGIGLADGAAQLGHGKALRIQFVHVPKRDETVWLDAEGLVELGAQN